MKSPAVVSDTLSTSAPALSEQVKLGPAKPMSGSFAEMM
jgi:hypothetical protein